jgi:16S rRNA (uracil1498-N3)-methyltransferase
VSTFFADIDFSAAALATLGEQVAHHARVKRLAVGDTIHLSNGRGSLATGEIIAIRKQSVEVKVDAVHMVQPPAAIHLRAPIADRDRMLLMAEKATELGIATWQSVRFQRSMSVSPRGEGLAFADKLRGRMIAALEQSGSAWLPQILKDTTVESIEFSRDELPIVLDASGASLASLALDMSAKSPVILVGPEGGIESDEMRRLNEAGWQRVRLAPNTLRFETAGIAAVAAIRSSRHNGER